MLLHAQNITDFSECLPTDNNTTPDEIYTERLGKLNTTIKMTYNKDVRNRIERYTKHEQAAISYILGASKFYFPIFEKVLKEYNMPLELCYISAIESMMKPEAVSRKEAAGIWQLKAITAIEQGLKINSMVDERLDTFKSTDAALHYLRFLYKLLDDNWTLAVAAYNCGLTRVERAIAKANGSHDFWEIRKYLPIETRDYLPKFIAMAYILNYYREHGISPAKTDLPELWDTVTINHQISLKQISDICNLDYAYIKKLNPQYRTTLIHGEKEPATICLPKEAKKLLVANKSSVKCSDEDK